MSDTKSRETNLNNLNLYKILTNILSKCENHFTKIEPTLTNNLIASIYLSISDIHQISIKIKAFLPALRSFIDYKTLVWEELHADKWDKIPNLLRDAYSFCCLKIIWFFLKQRLSKNPKISVVEKPFYKSILKCVKIADLAILLGSDKHSAIFNDLANDFVKILKETPFNAKFSISGHSVFNAKIAPCEILHPVDTLNATENDIQTFLPYFQNQRPVVLKKAINSWPSVNPGCAHYWGDINYLNSVAGFRTVPIEIGQNYLASDWGSKLMRFSKFIENYIVLPNSKIGYLAQHTLFDQIPELKRDIAIPDYCYLGKNPHDVTLNIWLGPKDTVSPLHFDPKHNIYAQITGSKYLRLISPEINPDKLYAQKSEIHKNSSQIINVRDYDTKSFPLFEKVPFVEVKLEAGDLLYIPPKWWHFVQSLSPAINISFWFD